MTNETEESTREGKIGAAVLRRMERMKISRKEMCRRMVVSRPRLSEITSGLHPITDKTMKKLAAAFDVKESTILREAGV